MTITIAPRTLHQGHTITSLIAITREETPEILSKADVEVGIFKMHTEQIRNNLRRNTEFRHKSILSRSTNYQAFYLH